MSYDLIISCCSATKSCPTLCNPMDCSREDSVSFTISPSLHKFLSIELVMSSNYLILCHPLPLCLQSFPASGYFPMNTLYATGGQSIGASASFLPMNIQG